MTRRSPTRYEPSLNRPVTVFLTNTSPAKCHIHTVNRLPNCEDYGKALIRQWKQKRAERSGVAA